MNKNFAFNDVDDEDYFGPADFTEDKLFFPPPSAPPRSPVRASLNINYPVFHTKPLCEIEYGLALVGILRLGVAPFEPRHVPHGRNFDVFAVGDFTYNGEYVKRVYVPTIAAHGIQAKALNTMGISTSFGTLCWGNAEVKAVVGGIRPKMDGVEVIQFVVETISGKYAFVYDVDRVYQVETTEPATYERVGNDYYLIVGVADRAVNVKDHPWYEPTLESLDAVLSEDSIDGVIVNMNGLDARISLTPNSTLQSKDGRFVDDNSRIYRGTPPAESEGKFFDCQIVNMGAICIRARPDKRRADTSVSVEFSRRSLTLDQFRLHLPLRGRSIVSPSYKYVDRGNPLSYARSVFQETGVAPSSWGAFYTGAIPTNQLSVDNVIAVLMRRRQIVTPALLMKTANDAGSFILGEGLKSLRMRPPPLITTTINDIFYSTEHFVGATAMVLMLDPSGDFADYDKATFVYKPGVRGVKLFSAKTVVEIAQNKPQDLVASIVEMLSNGPFTAKQLAVRLNVDKHNVNSVLYHRTDLFVLVRDTRPPLWHMVPHKAVLYQHQNRS